MFDEDPRATGPLSGVRVVDMTSVAMGRTPRKSSEIWARLSSRLSHLKGMCFAILHPRVITQWALRS